MYEIKPKYSEGLHVLRGLAAVSVVFFHAAEMGQKADVGALTAVGQFGAGVILFFVLSGYSLTLSNAGRAQEPGWLRDYAIKRFFRIAPLWYLMVAVSMAFQYVHFQKVYPLTEIAAHVLPLFPFSPGFHNSLVWAGWTIGVEVLFYLVFPVMLAAFGLRLLPWAAVTALAVMVSVGFAATLPPDMPGAYPHMGFPRQFPVFCFGALACVALLSAPAAMQPRIRLGAAFVSAAMFAWWGLTIAAPERFVLVQPMLFKAATLALLAVACSPRRHLLYNPVTKFWGDASYGVYLIHPLVVFSLKPAQDAYYAALPGPEVAFLAFALTALLITSSLAFLVHACFEAPLFRYGQRLAARPVGAAAR